MLRLDLINNIIRVRFPDLVIIRSGQDNESPPLPYLSYSFIAENKYKDNQVIRQLTETTTEYKNVNATDYRYTLVSDPAQDASEGESIIVSEKTIRDIYNFLTSLSFELSMNRIDTKYNLLSDVQEVTFDQNGFFERRFLFTIRFFWADLFVEQEAERIETIQGTNLNENANGSTYSQTKP